MLRLSLTQELSGVSPAFAVPRFLNRAGRFNFVKRPADSPVPRCSDCLHVTGRHSFKRLQFCVRQIRLYGNHTARRPGIIGYLSLVVPL